MGVTTSPLNHVGPPCGLILLEGQTPAPSSRASLVQGALAPQLCTCSWKAQPQRPQAHFSHDWPRTSQLQGPGFELLLCHSGPKREPVCLAPSQKRHIAHRWCECLQKELARRVHVPLAAPAEWHLPPQDPAIPPLSSPAQPLTHPEPRGWYSGTGLLSVGWHCVSLCPWSTLPAFMAGGCWHPASTCPKAPWVAQPPSRPSVGQLLPTPWCAPALEGGCCCLLPAVPLAVGQVVGEPCTFLCLSGLICLLCDLPTELCCPPKQLLTLWASVLLGQRFCPRAGSHVCWVQRAHLKKPLARWASPGVSLKK